MGRENNILGVRIVKKSNNYFEVQAKYKFFHKPWVGGDLTYVGKTYHWYGWEVEETFKTLRKAQAFKNHLINSTKSGEVIEQEDL